MFNCQDINAFVDSFIDEEFDAREHAEIEIHLARCENCRLLVEYRIQVKRLVNQSLRTTAPDSLREKILSSLSKIEPEQPRNLVIEPTKEPSNEVVVGETVALSAAPVVLDEASNTNQHVDADVIEFKRSGSSGGFFAPRNKKRVTQTVAALLAVAALVMFVAFVPQWTVAPATTDNLSIWEESVDWHRSDFPMEISGPDSPKVANWFTGKVNFAVEPLNFGTAVSSKLVGGRLASVNNRRAALLDYIVDNSNVTVLIFDGKGITVPADKLQTIDNQKIAVVEGPGYDVALFHKDDLTYTITADLPSAKFEQLIHYVLQSNK